MNKEVILAHLKTIKEAAEVALQNCIESDTKARSKGGGKTFDMKRNVTIGDVSLKISFDGEESIVVDIWKANCQLLCLTIYQALEGISHLPIDVRSEW